MKLKRNMRAWKKRNWSAKKAARYHRKYVNRVKASLPVDMVASMVLPYHMYVRIDVPGRLLAKSKVRGR